MIAARLPRARNLHRSRRSTMFHATIHDDERNPFCLSGHVTPYDLELLRDHIIARFRAGLRVEVRLPASYHPLVTRALRDAARRGVTVDVVESWDDVPTTGPAPPRPALPSTDPVR